MKRIRRNILSILLVLIVMVMPSMSVFAKEGMAMTIRGPGIQGEITLGNSDLLTRLEDTGFFGFSNNIRQIQPLENPGEGYNITAYIINDGKLIPFVQMVYYPANKGQAGYVHYLSKVNGDSLKPVDEWGKLPRSADQAFRALMTAQKITLQPAVLLAPSPVIMGLTPVQISYLAMAITIILGIVGARLILKRRVATQQMSRKDSSV